MKNILILCIALLSVQALHAQLYHEDLLNRNLTFKQIVDETEAYYDKIGRVKGNGYKQFQRWKYWADRNLDASGRVRSDFDALQSFSKFRKETSINDRLIDGSYQELGPTSAINTSTWSSALGRVTSIGLDPSNDNHIIVGSETGGIWKTLDLGGTWTPLFDDQLLMDVFALEISHVDPDTYWAGLNGDLVMSTDGGISWSSVGGISSGLFNTIEMHPADPNTIFAIEQSAGRVWKSTNGGQSFASVMDHSNSMYDLEFHPTNPNIIYASGNGAMYKSTNGGNSFSEINAGPWTGDATRTMMMAVTPAAPSNVYILEETGGGFNAVYFSDNEGQSWTTITDNTCGCQNMLGYNQNGGGGQAPRDMDIIVSPINSNIIHIAGVETWRTTDLGLNWIQTTFWNKPGQSDFIHADIDLLIYDNSRIVAGTDGGIYFSTDEAISWTDITSGLGIRQFYRIGASQTDTDRVSGGSQDNGTGVVVSEVWYDWLGADGMETFIDWSNADKIYGTSQFGGLYKSIDGGQTTASITTPDGASNWVTPFEQDPIEASTIYTGRQEVFKSIDEGQTWEAISAFGAGAIDELKIAPSDNNYIYAAVNSTMYYSSDGGNSWNSSSTQFNVNYIAVHPLNPQRLAVALTGTSNRVYESLDGGASWTNISANLPSGVGIECVLYEQVQGGGLFCGGNPGIYFTPNTSSPNWEDSSNNLPKVRVSELEIRNQVMYVATYGRGLWKFEFVCDGTLAGQTCNDLDVCTINDVFDANCNCAGTYTDSDSDGVCDGLDVCAGGDDNQDGDNDGVPDFCDGCAVGCPDADCDSVCDANDICPDGDDTRDMDGDGIPDYCDPCDDIIGTPCNDGDACTINDVYDSDCNCVGTFADADADGVCDANDACEGFDDSLDIDSDGEPDDCDDCNDLVETPKINLEIKLDNYPSETSWSITDAVGNIVFSSNGTYTGFATGTIVTKAFCSFQGGCYDFTIDDSYGDGIFSPGYYLLRNAAGDTLAYGFDFGSTETTEFCLDCSNNGGDADGDLICADVDCDDTDASVGVSIIGTSCDDQDACTNNDIWISACNCQGTFIDSDNDGICNIDDICPFDVVNVDNDNDGVCVERDCDDNDPFVGARGTVGQSCNDGDACTINDVYVTECECIGTFEDSDNDGICDINDACDNDTNPDLFLELKFDGFAFETTWDITDASGNIISEGGKNGEYAGGNSDDTLNVNICIPDGCFDFNLYDSGSDGLCCFNNGFDGYYILRKADGTVLASGGEYGDVETTPFCVDSSDCSAQGGDADQDGICAANDCDDTNAAIGSVGSSCDDGDICTTGDIYDTNCNCAGTFADADNDGICDVNDQCPGINDNLIGSSCDDGDVCTTGDVYDNNCNCAGTFADADGDGVCDTNDICALGDDTIDSDGDGIPDACETDSCTNITNSISPNPLTHSGSGSNSTTLSYSDLNQDVSFTISNINQKLNGPQSRRYIERVTVSFVDANGVTQVEGIYSGSNVSTAAINIAGPIQSLTIRLEDSLDGNSGNSTMNISFTDVNSCELSGPPDCTPGDPCDDGNSITINDAYDSNCQCIGDLICTPGDPCDDGDSNTINDQWDSDCQCIGEQIIDPNCNPITTSGTNVSSANGSQNCVSFSYNLLQTDIQFSVSGIDTRTNGKRSSRYRDLVSVEYRDQNGTTVEYGTYTSNFSITITDPLSFLIVCIEDSDGQQGASVQATISDIESCESNTPPSCNTSGPCDDAISCTSNDQYQADCSCLGVELDSDGDGVCDGNDICPGSNDLIDIDNDGIPDACDDCLDFIENVDNQFISIDQSAVTTISSNNIVQSAKNVSFNAGVSVELTEGFTVESGAIFEAYIESCIQ